MTLNYVFISPHFPPNWYLFAVRLAEFPNVRVLAVGEAPYDDLRIQLKKSLTEYYRVDNMEDYDQVLRAVGYFTHRYGKINRIESHNEHWIELDAKLRTDFNVFGYKTHNIDFIKRKSRMKELFVEAKVNVVQGKAINSREEAQKFADEYEFPVVVKPDIGVGARGTHMVRTTEDFDAIPEEEFVGAFAEQFVEGKIETFDGLADRDGNLIFYTSHSYSQGLMELAKANTHAYFYNRREIPQDLLEAGQKTVKAFDVRERFFHIEYFRRNKDQKLVGLEINVRPPGGFTMDQFNYAHDSDLYKKYAQLVVNNDTAFEYSRPHHIIFVSRKNHIPYGLTHEEILADPVYGSRIVFNGEMPPALGLMGNTFFMFKTPDLDEALQFVQLVWRTPHDQQAIVQAQEEQLQKEAAILRQKELDQQQQFLLQQARVPSSPTSSRARRGSASGGSSSGASSGGSSGISSGSTTPRSHNSDDKLSSSLPKNITPTVTSITTPISWTSMITKTTSPFSSMFNGEASSGTPTTDGVSTQQNGVGSVPIAIPKKIDPWLPSPSSSPMTGSILTGTSPIPITQKKTDSWVPSSSPMTGSSPIPITPKKIDFWVPPPSSFTGSSPIPTTGSSFTGSSPIPISQKKIDSWVPPPSSTTGSSPIPMTGSSFTGSSPVPISQKKIDSLVATPSSTTGSSPIPIPSVVKN